MGLRTLGEFREDLSTVIGNRGVSNPWLDRRVNSAYMEVATGDLIRHEELRERVALQTAAEQEAYEVEPGVIGIEQVVILEGEGLQPAKYLSFTGDIDQYRREGAIGLDGGRPQVWTLEGKDLRLRPVPDDEYSLQFIAYREPTLMSAVDSITEIDARWDQGIHLMAVHYALLDVGEEERAGIFFTRARQYLGSRIKDGSERRSVHGVPTPMPEVHEEMVRARRVP